jgi:hypothetical protein
MCGLVSSSLPCDFTLPTLFMYGHEDFKVLGILGFIPFMSSFIESFLLEDFKHDLPSKMGDFQMAFGIPTHYFLSCPSYLFRHIPPISTFLNLFTSFDLFLFWVLECIIGPRSFWWFWRKFSLLSIFYSHFSRRNWSHFHCCHYPNFIIRELGTNCFILGLLVFALSSSFSIQDFRSHWFQHLPFPTTIEGPFAPNGPWLSSPSSINKSSGFKTPFQNVYTSTPFLTCFLLGCLTSFHA